MNIILFANWGLGKLVLEQLLRIKNVNIIAVVTQHNKDIDDDYYNLVYDFAKINNLKIYDSYKSLPQNLLHKADVGLSVAYAEIFKSDILSQIKILNLHPSFLPDFRGPSPLNWQIKEGVEDMGATLHFVDEAIDEGEIYEQQKFKVDKSLVLNDYVDAFNVQIAQWAAETLQSYNPDKPLIKAEKKNYYHRLFLPAAIKEQPVSEINFFLKRKRVAVYSGNRAEFGIILPLLEKLAEKYNVDLILSGAHVQAPWNTKTEVYSAIKEKQLAINVIEVPHKKVANYYRDNFTTNFNFGINYFKKYASTYPIELLIVLGDRVETYAFANAAFFSQLPICHMYGGDISNVPYFDTNIRHAITKISNLHLCSNEQSRQNILSMGEEEWRVELIGNTSLDNYTNGNFASKNELMERYGIQDQLTVIFTYHASQFLSAADNFTAFKKVWDIILHSEIQTVVTYPNNDEGHELITDYLYNFQQTPLVKVVNNLGIKNYLGLIKEFDTIVTGNTSSGLFETVLYGRPAINIGDRQTDRPRAKNVVDVKLDELEKLKGLLADLQANYNDYVKNNLEERYYFGSGNSVKTAADKIDSFLKQPKEKLVLKKFIARK